MLSGTLTGDDYIRKTSILVSANLYKYTKSKYYAPYIDFMEFWSLLKLSSGKCIGWWNVYSRSHTLGKGLSMFIAGMESPIFQTYALFRNLGEEAIQLFSWRLQPSCFIYLLEEENGLCDIKYLINKNTFAIT